MRLCTEGDGIKWEVQELGKMDELYERACQKLDNEAVKLMEGTR